MALSSKVRFLAIYIATACAVMIAVTGGFNPVLARAVNRPAPRPGAALHIFPSSQAS
jgi:hypothetical protein